MPPVGREEENMGEKLSQHLLHPKGVVQVYPDHRAPFGAIRLAGVWELDASNRSLNAG